MKKKISIFFLSAALLVCLSACSLGSSDKYASWPVFKNKELGVRFHYREDLAHKNKDVDQFNLCVGFFEKGAAVEEGAKSYPIEFAVLSPEKESQYVNGGRYVSGFKKGDKFYYFSTYERDKYGETVDKMAESLEFTE
jgi:hypothetical protein